MPIKNKILIMINIFWAFSAQASESNVDPILANLWVNELDMNTDVTLIKQNNQFYIECSILKEKGIDIARFQILQSKPEFCSISDGQVQSLFDEGSQAIKVTVPSGFFISNTFDQTIQMPEKASLGGFFNYELFYANSDAGNRYSGLTELGVFKDFWLFKNAMLYQNQDEINKFIRLNSSIDFEFPEKMTRLTLGDTTTVYNPLINSLRFGGLSWGTNFTERPNFIYWNVPSLEGSARVPSTVELYVNGVNIYNQKVSPGDYNLQTGAQIQQSGNAQIVVEDILGNRSVQSFPIMVTSKLLRPGLNEYNVSLGKLRYNYNLESSDYRDFFANTFFRRGISNSTSLGINALYSQDIQNLGLMWTQAVSNWFLFESVAQASHDDRNDTNFSYGLSLSKDIGRFSFGANSKYTEQHFKFLGDELNNESSYPKFENLVYLGISGVPLVQNINLNFAEQKYYKNETFERDDRRIFRAGFSRQIGRKMILGLNYFNETGDRSDSGATLSLSYSFDSQKTLYMSHSTAEDSNVQFVKNDTNQVGFDYAFGANRRNGEILYNVDGRLKTEVGDLELSHQQSDSYRESQVYYRGAVVMLNKKFNFTKAVDNAFALVKVDSYPDIDIYRALNHVDKTNKEGYAFVHDIIPYVKYDIAFDENQLPIEDKILYSNKQITALNQRGYAIDFPIYHAKQVTVRPVNAQGKTFDAASEVYVNNSDGDVYPLSSDGTVTLYGLIPQTYHLTIKSKEEQDCKAELVVKDKQTEQNNQPVDISCK